MPLSLLDEDVARYGEARWWEMECKWHVENMKDLQSTFAVVRTVLCCDQTV